MFSKHTGTCHPTEALSDPVLVSDPSFPSTHTPTHMQKLPQGEPHTDSHPSPVISDAPSDTEYCRPAPRQVPYPLSQCSVAGSPSWQPLGEAPPHALSYTVPSPQLGDTCEALGGTASALALLASIIPVDSEPLRLPPPVCHSFQGPNWRRDRGHHLRAAAGRGTAARDSRLPVQVLLLPLPSHHPQSLCLVRSP